MRKLIVSLLLLASVGACSRSDTERMVSGKPVSGEPIVFDEQARRERDAMLEEIAEKTRNLDNRLARMESRMRTVKDDSMTATYEQLRAARADLDRLYRNIETGTAETVRAARTAWDKAADEVEKLYEGLVIDLGKLGHALPHRPSGEQVLGVAEAHAQL